eukprot:GHUV01052039.1.p1 GENE.GHUV01052039.1~~GHUV01052039.1.p1  ORF type:complete len:115 (+),score=27.74 GHUV01052039.1:194-538(+)
MCVPQVWDLRNQRCLQTLTDSSTYYPENKLSALAYSPDRKLLVSCAYYPKGWQLIDNRQTGGAGHRDPVSWVGFNNMFCEVGSYGGVNNSCHGVLDATRPVLTQLACNSAVSVQ